MNKCAIVASTLTAAGLAQADTTISTFELPEGNVILQVTGALDITTGGGDAIGETTTIYYFAQDFGDPEPNLPDFSGTVWPYVYVDGDLFVEDGITALITTLFDGTGDLLLIEGNPVYQFINDAGPFDANGNVGPFNYITPTGEATQQRVPTPGAAIALGAGGLMLARRRR